MYGGNSNKWKRDRRQKKRRGEEKYERKRSLISGREIEGRKREGEKKSTKEKEEIRGELKQYSSKVVEEERTTKMQQRQQAEEGDVRKK